MKVKKKKKNKVSFYIFGYLFKLNIESKDFFSFFSNNYSLKFGN